MELLEWLRADREDTILAFNASGDNDRTAIASLIAAKFPC